jgi:hypothetical protein
MLYTAGGQLGCSGVDQVYAYTYNPAVIHELPKLSQYYRYIIWSDNCPCHFMSARMTYKTFDMHWMCHLGDASVSQMKTLSAPSLHIANQKPNINLLQWATLSVPQVTVN